MFRGIAFIIGVCTLDNYLMENKMDFRVELRQAKNRKRCHYTIIGWACLF